MYIGQRLPMYIAALGRCMAAHSGLDRAQLRHRFETLRWEDGPDFDDYWKEVLEARAKGYATDTGNYVKGVRTASAAVLDSSGEALMAISAVGFAAAMSRSRLKALGEDLRDRATEITRALSGLPQLNPDSNVSTMR
jgi:DNA-binding IclR family transcriptional regulator